MPNALHKSVCSIGGTWKDHYCCLSLNRFQVNEVKMQEKSCSEVHKHPKSYGFMRLGG